MLGRIFQISLQFAMVLGGGVDGIERIAQHKFVLRGFFRLYIGRVLECPQFGLTLGVGLDDGLQRLADIVFAANISRPGAMTASSRLASISLRRPSRTPVSFSRRQEKPPAN
jgi:hypothetical protein